MAVALLLLPLCLGLGAAPALPTPATVAQAYLGEPYVWGDIGEAGFDCSSFVQAVFRQSGIRLPRSSREQVSRGSPVALADVRPGDLLFFSTTLGGRHIHHVGLALPGNRMIHAARGHHRVVISRWDSAYFLGRWVAARRVAAPAVTPPRAVATLSPTLALR